MRRSASLPVVLLVAVVMAACGDRIVTPTRPLASPSMQFDMAAAGSASGKYVVVFATGIPADFSASVQALGGRVVFPLDAVDAAVVTGLDDTAVNALRRVKGVQYVEPEPMFNTGPVNNPELASVDVTPASSSDPTAAIIYARQWNMRAIRADQAWAAGYRGSPDVTVAILDSGIGYTNYDLAGLVDLDRSASFVGPYKDISGFSDDDYVSMFFPGAHLIADIGYHGTHVAATVASNGILAAGVTSHVTLIGAKVCSVALGTCPGGAVMAGLLWAVGHGADVVNLSLEGYFNLRLYPGYVSLLNRYYTYAHSRGVTIVVAAGNESVDMDHNGDLFVSECNVPNVVCVAATGPTSSLSINGPWTDVDSPASYTNYGRSAVNVAAPGGDAGGYIWAACSRFSLVIPDCQAGGYVIGMTGTSMASPHVAGTAALLVERYGRHPGLIKTALEQTADDLGQPGTDPYYGKGRINTARAVGAM